MSCVIVVGFFLNPLNHCHLLKNGSKSEHCALNTSVLYYYFFWYAGVGVGRRGGVCVCERRGGGRKCRPHIPFLGAVWAQANTAAAQSDQDFRHSTSQALRLFLSLLTNPPGSDILRGSQLPVLHDVQISLKQIHLLPWKFVPSCWSLHRIWTINAPLEISICA